jgi:hypothetical protein
MELVFVDDTQLDEDFAQTSFHEVNGAVTGPAPCRTRRARLRQRALAFVFVD